MLLTLRSLTEPQGPVIFTINLSGTITPAGIVTKQLAKNLSGQISPSATPPSKVSSKQFASTTTPSGALLKFPQKIFTATLMISGATSGIVQHQRSFSGAISLSGSVVNLHTAQRSFSGQTSYSGDTTLFPSKLWSSTMTPTGTLSISTSKPFGGLLTLSGALSKTLSKAFSGSVTGSGLVLNQLTKNFSGSLTNAGTLATYIARLRDFGGSLTVAGTLSFGFEINSFGSITPTGALTKGVEKSWNGELAPAGTLTKEIPKDFSGVVTSAGTLTTATVRTYTINLDGVIALSGNVEVAFVEAILPDVSGPTPGFKKSRRPATVTAVPSLYGRSFAGSVSFAGRLELLAGRSITPAADVVPTLTADDIVSIRVVPRERVYLQSTTARFAVTSMSGTLTSGGGLMFERVLFVDADELIFDGGLFG